MVADNFVAHGFTEEEVTTATCKDGTPLLDRLAADKDRRDAGEISMGKKYYELLRAETRNPVSSFAQLNEMQKTTVDTNEDLEEALLGIFAAKRRRSSLSQAMT